MGGSDPHGLYRLLSSQTTELISGLPQSWAVVGDFDQPWDATVLQIQGVHERFDRVVDALHLLHDELVEYPFVMAGEGRPPIYSQGTRGAPFPPIQAWNRAYNHPYVFSGVDVNPLKELAILLDTRFKSEPEGATTVAVGRVNATHLRSSEADRIIDSAIALEAILLKGSDDELSYRQALRGVHLLGGSESTRFASFSLLKKAYARRSKIVHGMRDPGTPSTEAIVSITRRIVQAFVFETRTATHDELIERLDESAVRGSVSKDGV